MHHRMPVQCQPGITQSGIAPRPASALRVDLARAVVGLGGQARTNRLPGPRLANTALEGAWLRSLLSRALGLSAKRPLPHYAFERFDQWFARHQPARPATRGSVILWDDTF